MGLFNIFYPNRPGKGVDKDEPEKNALFQFWTLFGRRLGRLVLLNIIYFILVSPLLTVGYFYANDFFGIVSLTGTVESEEAAVSEAPEIAGESDTEVNPEDIQLPPLGLILIFLFLQKMPREVFFALVILSAVLFGPVTCGYAYILRNFARRQHAWVSDLWSRTKKNFLQGIQMGTVEILFVLLFFASLSATSNENLIGVEGSMRMVLYVCRYASIGVGLLWLFMRNYFYVMIVTFNLKTREVLKNSFIFAVVGLPRNIIALLVQIVFLFISLIMLWFFSEFFEFLYTGLLMLSLCGFAGIFITYPVVKKYLIDPLNLKNDEQLEES